MTTANTFEAHRDVIRLPNETNVSAIPNGSKNCCDTIQREVGGGVSVVGTEMAEDILERACFAQQKVHSASN